jgi:hypothetical protein
MAAVKSVGEKLPELTIRFESIDVTEAPGTFKLRTMASPFCSCWVVLRLLFETENKTGFAPT